MYEIMLEAVRNKMKAIEQIALEDDAYNSAWTELAVIENSLIKLIKLKLEN